LPLKSAVTLRWLAGVSYLDLAWGYELPHNTIHSYFYEVLEAIDSTHDNINFPINDMEKLIEIEQGFSALSGGLFRNTVAAGDGIVFEISKPPPNQVNEDVTSFYTRKGYFAFGLQAFVDSKCRFLSIASRRMLSVLWLMPSKKGNYLHNFILSLTMLTFAQTRNLLLGRVEIYQVKKMFSITTYPYKDWSWSEYWDF